MLTVFDCSAEVLAKWVAEYRPQLSGPLEAAQRLDCVLAEGTGDVGVDMSEVTFLDSGGLVALLHARQALHDKHRRLKIRNPSKPVLRVFDLGGVLDVMMDGRQPPVDSGRAAEA